MGHPERISIGCVQARVSLADYAGADTFRTMTQTLMEQATSAMPADTPRLVVFPEDYASGCIFAGEEDALKDTSSLRGAVAALVRRHFTGVMAQRLRHRVGWVRALALHRADAVAELYFDTFSELARAHSAYVLAGTVLLPEMHSAGGRMEPRGGDVYNVAYLFGPDGQVIGSQRKAFLIDLEGSDALDLSPGDVEDLAVFDTELGRIGIAVCFDGFQVPVIERFKNMDVDIFLQPSANPGPWSDWQQQDWLNGMWHAVVEEGVATYGVNPMLVGSLLDVAFEGQSSIICRDPARLAEVTSAMAGDDPGASVAAAGDAKDGAGGAGVAAAEAEDDDGGGGTARDATGTESDEGAEGVGTEQSGLSRLGYAALPPRPGFVRVARSWTDAEVLTVTLPHPRRLTPPAAED